MNAFLEYFFGAGTQQEFALFTVAHFAPIVVMIGIILLIRRFRTPLQGWKHEPAIRYVLAFALICSEMAYYWRLVGMPSLGPNPVENLPISVCGWAVIFCSFMVIGKTQSLFDISYFWLLCASVFALLTPTPLNFTGPTRFRYYQFWAEHTLGYIAVFYMIFIHNMRPTVKSAIRSWIALAILAVIAYCANVLIGPGANYLYMAKPEAAPSVLDILPPNFALRLTIMAAVITALYFVAYLPWYLKDRKAKKKEPAQVG
jgi:hypothetical integral membrane protein (TIGR02206 family)